MMTQVEFARLFVRLWRDWEAIFGKDYEGMDFDMKWGSFIRHLDLNSQPPKRTEKEVESNE